VAITVLCLFVSTLCFAQKTSIDWNRGADFSSYHTYMWEASPNPAKGEWNQRIIDDIDKQLQAKGLTKVDSNPDVWVVYSNSIQHDKQVVGVGYVGGGGLPLTGASPTSHATFVYKVGTLVVEIADTKTKQLVWRGAVSDTLSDKQNKNITTLDKAVTKLFRSYPPKDKK